MKWNHESLGMLELSSIAGGVRAADEMMKAAGVELLEAIPISSGKFLVIVAGGVAEVEASLDAGRRCAGSAIVDELRLATVHPDVGPAIARPRGEQSMRTSLGVVETTTVAAAIIGADAAAKAADVLLLEIAPGRGIGGKGFFTLTGDVASVQAGADAARAVIDRRDAHVRTEILAGPHPSIRARVARMLMGPFERMEGGEA
jgi:microcompartment protein CcmL/EutN